MRAISHQAHEAIRVLQMVIDTEEISVPDAAKHLDKTPAWIHENLPVIYHSRKSHSVRLKDLAHYQATRTVIPTKAVMKFAKRLKKTPQWVRENLPVIYSKNGEIAVKI